MAIRWERLAGDTDAFAIRIAFLDDPDDGAAIDCENARSWGSYQLWVQGINLCAHTEQGERVESVHWYLLPLLEWFVEQWNPLLHEERLPNRNKDDTGWAALRRSPVSPSRLSREQEELEDRRCAEWQAWRSRHALASAREGGIFPDVAIRRLRDSIEVSWGRGEPPGTPGHFSFDASHPGAATLPPAAVADALFEMLRGASAYLRDAMPQSGRIEALAAGVRKLAQPQPSERHMWLAGLGADAKTARNGWKRARSFARKLSEPVDALLFSKSGDSRLVIEGSCHAALMFGSVSPSIDASDVRALCRTMIELSSADGACGRSASHAAPTPVTADWPPWEQGYELACDLHEDLGEQFLGGDSVDIDALLRHLGVEVRELALSDSEVRGVAIAGPQHRASVAWNPCSPFNQTDAGKRFTLAHELCHILFDQEAGRRLAIASGPWAPHPIEQRANAFAAMLLMPWPLLQRCVAGMHAQAATEEDIRAIAQRLRTGFGATLRHLCIL